MTYRNIPAKTPANARRAAELKPILEAPLLAAVEVPVPDAAELLAVPVALEPEAEEPEAVPLVPMAVACHSC